MALAEVRAPLALQLESSQTPAMAHGRLSYSLSRDLSTPSDQTGEEWTGEDGVRMDRGRAAAF